MVFWDRNLEFPLFFFSFFLIISRRIILHNLMLQFIKFIDFAISDNRTLSLETFTRTIKLWNIFTQIIDTYYYLHPTFQIRKACSKKIAK